MNGMKRKVAQIGPSTLMVSLPNKWVVENNVKKGDELEVTPQEKEIVFSLSERKQKEKEITADISSFSSFWLTRYLETLYINNYTKIILTYSNKEILRNPTGELENLRQCIKRISNRFIGMEIVAQTASMTELHCFISHEEQDIEKIEKRIFFLWKDAIDELLHHIEKDTPLSYQEIYDQHDNIIRFITYYLRMLGQSPLPEEEKRQRFAFYMVFDKVLDKYRHLGNRIEQYGCSKKVKKYLDEIFTMVHDLFLMMYKQEANMELIKKRYDLVARIDKEKFTLEELRVMAEADIFLNILNDLGRMVIVKKLAVS